MKTIKNITKLAFIAILMAAFTANAQETRVTKTIKMLDFLNKAVIDANQAQGGLHTVADEAGRLAIHVNRAHKGMIVVQQDNGAMYRLDDVAQINANAGWTQLATIPGWNVANAATYDIGVTVFNGGVLYVSLIDNNGDTPGVDATWRKVGDITYNAVATIAARDALTNVSEGDIANVADANAAVGGAQAAAYVYDGAAWQLLYMQRTVTITTTAADLAARNALTANALAGDMVEVTDIDPVGAGNQRGLYVRNNTVFNTGTPNHDACWTTIVAEKAAGVVDNTATVYYGNFNAFTALDETAVKALKKKLNADDYTQAVPTADFTGDDSFAFAYPADWTGTPVFYMTFDEDGAGPGVAVTFPLTDCWNVYDVVVDTRRYKVFQTNIDLSGATGATVEVK